MKSWKCRACALTLLTAAYGCAPIPEIDEPQRAAGSLTELGEPLEFKTCAESIDVPGGAVGARLTLSSAIQQAVRHDAGLQAALARVRQAEAEAKQARLLPNPVLSLALRFPEGGGKPDVEGSVSADLLSLLLMPGRISAADGRLRKSTAEAMVVLLDVIADVQRQYAKVQSLSARAEIDEVRGRILSDLRRTTEARLKAGEAARLDVLTVQGESARADSERLARLTESRQAALVLARMIGQPSAEPSWRIDPWQPTGIPDRTEQDWIKLALERRPELQEVIWELGALGQEMKIARLGTLIESSDAGPDFERAEGQWAWGPGALIGIPLFDFGQAQRDLIRARVIEQRHEQTRIERSIVEQVRVAIESLKSAQGVLANVEQELIPIQSERLEQARQSYRHGSADVLAVKLAEQDLQQAKSEQIELQDQVSQAVYGLMRATGGALANHSETPSTQPEIPSQSNTVKENHK